MIRLRFVRGTGLLSEAILLGTRGEYSHVEAVTPDGKYLGARAEGGVLARDVGYDAGQFSKELFLDLPADDTMTERFYAYLSACIGEPYDFGAIAGFVMLMDEHEKHRVICSALDTLALRDCEWFPFPLARPPHEISPRDLLLMVSTRVNIGA